MKIFSYTLSERELRNFTKRNLYPPNESRNIKENCSFFNVNSGFLLKDELHLRNPDTLLSLFAAQPYF